MSLTPDEAMTAISQAVAELNISLPPEKQISSDPDAILFGEGGQLDSLGLVNLVMAAEQHIGDLSGGDIVLASEAALSRKRSPYRTLRRLAEYAAEVAAQDSGR